MDKSPTCLNLISPAASLLDLLHNFTIYAKWNIIGIVRQVKILTGWVKEKTSLGLEKLYSKNKIEIIKTASQKLNGNYSSRNWSVVELEEVEVVVWINKNTQRNAIEIQDKEHCEGLDLKNPMSASWAKVYFVIGFYMVSAGENIDSSGIVGITIIR